MLFTHTKQRQKRYFASLKNTIDTAKALVIVLCAAITLIGTRAFAEKVIALDDYQPAFLQIMQFGSTTNQSGDELMNQLAGDFYRFSSLTHIPSVPPFAQRLGNSPYLDGWSTAHLRLYEDSVAQLSGSAVIFADLLSGLEKAHATIYETENSNEWVGWQFQHFYQIVSQSLHAMNNPPPLTSYESFFSKSPIREWLQDYKEKTNTLLEKMSANNKPIILDPFAWDSFRLAFSLTQIVGALDAFYLDANVLKTITGSENSPDNRSKMYQNANGVRQLGRERGRAALKSKTVLAHAKHAVDHANKALEQISRTQPVELHTLQKRANILAFLYNATHHVEAHLRTFVPNGLSDTYRYNHILGSALSLRQQIYALRSSIHGGNY